MTINYLINHSTNKLFNEFWTYGGSGDASLR
jgi:hypothetical protein